MNLSDLSDEELRRWWCEQEPTDDGTTPLQDELAEEMERRGVSMFDGG